ncbi:MAG: N-acetylmuramoyl-L-alanine amidase [Candidatus Omnitrophica bacterium]|nr:N-acetylmuramoyl-L-alanine amidase [Candidatus Omnitrophota bacterium]
MRSKCRKALFLPVLLGILMLSSCTARHVETIRMKPEFQPGDFGGGVMREGCYHSVAPGETLWRISQMYDVDIETIKRVNNIRDVRDIDIGKRLYVPRAAERKNVITLYPNKKWKYIVLHHSATDSGSSEKFNRAHLRRGWKGVGYHFVIDNGTCGKDNGQIETSPRWTKQIDGAHCKADSMNARAIGICLVGNFSEDNMSAEQMDSLVYLVDTLKTYYGISSRKILGHSQVDGARTECPGTQFPWRKFWTQMGR